VAGTLRRCIGCGRSEPKAVLLRFVIVGGVPTWDPRHDRPGRGAYVHPTVACWSRLADVGRWQHAFRGNGPREREAYVRVMDSVRGRIEGLVEPVAERGENMRGSPPGITVDRRRGGAVKRGGR
jgi:predicted RNA-binding protein YlxR (DUF448 family)